MSKSRAEGSLAAAVVLSFCLGAAAQAPATQPADSREWLRLLDTVPGDCVAYVAVQSINGLSGKMQGFLKTFLPPRIVGELDVAKTVIQQMDLGPTFDANGPFAMVLLDPEPVDGRLMKKLQPDAEGDVNLGELGAGDLPVVFLLPGKDVAALFPGRKTEPDGELTKLTRDGQTAWALEKNGFLAVSFHPKALRSFSTRVTALVGLTAEHEKLALSSDALLWINRKRALELADTAFDFLVWDSLPLPKLRHLGPAGIPIKWMHLTREEVFRQADSMLLGFRMTEQGPWGQLRLHYAPGSVMGKALAAAGAVQGPLTANLPEGPFIFAYGARKDVFRTPAEVKAKQMQTAQQDPVMKPLPEDMREKFGKMVQAIHEEVTGVQHWAGQAGEMGPLGIANVVRCKDSAKLIALIKDNVPVFQALLNLAMGMQDEDKDKFTLKYDQAVSTLGDLKLDGITVTHPRLEEGLADEDMGPRLKNMMLKAFPGETKICLRLAPLDGQTVILILGGGKKFAEQALAAAQAGKTTALEAEPGAQAALAMLPANRFALAMVNVPNAVGFGSMAMMSVGGMSGAQLTVKPAPPVVVALSAEKSDLLITVHVPTAVIQAVVGLVAPLTGMGPPETGPAGEHY